MFGKITSLSLKSFLRSPAFSQNIGTTIMMLLMGLYFGLCSIALGAAAPFIAEKISDVGIPELIIGKYFLYTFLYLFLFRLVFQNFGFKALKKYILQPIKKSKIYHYILTNTISHWLNVIPLLGITAYLISASFAPEYNVNVLNHGLVLIGLLYFTNYFAFLVDKQLSVNKIITGGLIFLVVLLNFLDFQGIIPLGTIFENFFGFLTGNIGFAIIPIVGTIAAYLGSLNVLSKVAYLEDEKSDTSITEVNLRSGIFSRFGRAGEMMEMEVKLILRNKRSKNMMYVIGLIFLYPFMSSIETYDSIGWFMFIAIFTTGGFALTYGQLLLSWNSGHFDLLLTKMTSIKEIFQAKYYLQCAIVIAQSMILILYGFYKSEYFLLMPAMMFYNLGVVLFLYMLLASYNSKKVDTNKGAAMNYEGFSMSLFLIIIPIMFIPMILYYGCKFLLGNAEIGIYITALIGVLGFVFHDKLIDISVQLFKKNRYKIGTAFRTK